MNKGTRGLSDRTEFFSEIVIVFISLVSDWAGVV